jgi:hypothetical protein
MNLTPRPLFTFSTKANPPSATAADYLSWSRRRVTVSGFALLTDKLLRFFMIGAGSDSIDGLLRLPTE